MNFSELKTNKQGLVPTIIQDAISKKVLMLAYMNEESFNKSIKTNQTYFYSRSRKCLWHKGETSGNTQEIVSMSFDCDKDTLLIQVFQKGFACHTNTESCFDNRYILSPNPNINSLYDLEKIIKERRNNPIEKSYTNYLFNEGLDKILKKVGEETAEVIIASKNNPKETCYETCDLLYHLMVLMNELDISLKDLFIELGNR